MLDKLACKITTPSNPMQNNRNHREISSNVCASNGPTMLFKLPEKKTKMHMVDKDYEHVDWMDTNCRQVKVVNKMSLISDVPFLFIYLLCILIERVLDHKVATWLQTTIVMPITQSSILSNHLLEWQLYRTHNLVHGWTDLSVCIWLQSSMVLMAYCHQLKGYLLNSS